MTRRSPPRCFGSARRSGSRRSTRAGTTAAHRCRPPMTSRWSSPRTAAMSSRSSRAALEAGVRYVGLVASRKRGAAVLDALREDGVAGASCSSGSTRRPGSTSARARRPRSRCRSWPSIIEVAPAVGRRGAARRPRPRPRRSIPICGMTVVVDADALSLEQGGETHYFCGEGCRRAFERQHPA